MKYGILDEFLLLFWEEVSNYSLKNCIAKVLLLAGHANVFYFSLDTIIMLALPLPMLL